MEILSTRPNTMEQTAQSTPPLAPSPNRAIRPSITGTKTTNIKHIQLIIAFDIALKFSLSQMMMRTRNIHDYIIRSNIAK